MKINDHKYYKGNKLIAKFGFSNKVVCTVWIENDKIEMVHSTVANREKLDEALFVCDAYARAAGFIRHFRNIIEEAKIEPSNDNVI